MTPTILYIHGANATPTSFAFIFSNLPHHISYFFEYSVDDSLNTIVAQASDMLKEIEGPVTIVGHSLGGVIAACLAHEHPQTVKQVLTMSTPFGGSEFATQMAVLMPFNQLLASINKYNPTLLALRNSLPPCPVHSLITNAGGTSMISGENDGVVSVASQLDYPATTQLVSPNNHFEVLLDVDTAHFVLTHVFLP